LPSREGLVAEYSFAGSANDSSGAGAHGTVHGATLTSDRFGTPNHAYSFDGVDDYIEVALPPRLRADALTVSVWARFAPRDFDGFTNCIIAQDDGNDEDQSRRVFQVSAEYGHIVWHRMVGARDPLCRRRVRPGIWYHVAAVHDHGVNRLYVDGVLQDEVNHRLWTHETQPLHIGRKGTPEPYFFFKGAIDDVRLYDRALDAGEIDELFRERGWTPHPPPPLRGQDDPLSGWWGQHGVVFLDLRYDGGTRVAGRIMAGRPDNMAAIANGTFDRHTAALRLEGDAIDHRTRKPVTWVIQGILDEDEVAVTAAVDGYSGNHFLTRAGARLRLTRRSLRSHLGALAFLLRSPMRLSRIAP
jgi:hypothetical protein